MRAIGRQSVNLGLRALRGVRRRFLCRFLCARLRLGGETRAQRLQSVGVLWQ
jgi:hypothetical protein